MPKKSSYATVRITRMLKMILLCDGFFWWAGQNVGPFSGSTKYPPIAMRAKNSWAKMHFSIFPLKTFAHVSQKKIRQNVSNEKIYASTSFIFPSQKATTLPFCVHVASLLQNPKPMGLGIWRVARARLVRFH